MAVIMTAPDPLSTDVDRTLLRPGLPLVIAGTVGRGRRPARYYAGPGNRFFELLQASGLVPERLDPDHVDRLPDLGVGLTDLVTERVRLPGREPEAVIYWRELDRAITEVGPTVVAFVSKTAATWYARGVGHRLPKDYGEQPWTVAGVPAFVLPGPSGANNGMSLALRLALWTDLADFLDHLRRAP